MPVPRLGRVAAPVPLVPTPPDPKEPNMAAAFLVSTAVVALAEIGDKSQLLALLLTTRFRRPLPIIAGILAATLVNHALAGLAGEWLATRIDPVALRWAVGVSLLLVAAWTLKADSLDGTHQPAAGYNVFTVTLISFFLIEIGDKTQVATAILAAQYQALASVILGTTLGMVLANIPVVMLGSAIANRIPMRRVRIAAAAVFVAMGLLAFAGIGVAGP